jgi:hypothetical protein
MLLALLVWAAAPAVAVTTNDALRAETEGRELARRLRESSPPESVTHSARLLVRGKGRRIEIPVTISTLVTETNWQTRYLAQATNGLTRLTVTHTAGQPLECQTEPDPPASDPLSNRFLTPFADSDFWVVDLAVEFLHWPVQKVWRKELKKGQSCAVLESRPAGPAAHGYSRVVAWIDLDTGGIVQAEAYDARGKLLKEFEVKELEKVNGRLEVSEIQMRNVQTGSRTSLRFLFPKAS